MKAPHDGQYTVNGVPFRMFEGDPLPENAEVVAPADDDEADTKADAEPENKAEKAPAKKKD